MNETLVCLWLAGTACYYEPQPDKGMTNYLAKKYGGKKKRKYTKHKRYFKNEPRDIWEELDD